MTTPSSVAAIVGRQNIFRINQQVLGPGDLWEIDSASLAVWIGPSSDLSEVRLQFPLPSGANLVDQASVADVSVGGPFVGKMDCLLSQVYGATSQPARILAYPSDIVDPAYVRPTGAGAVPKRRYNLPAYVDLVFALSQPPSIPTARADRTFRLARVPFQNAAGMSDDGSTDIVIPIYGRRMVTVQVQTPAGVAHLDSYYLAALQPGTTQPFAKFLGDRTYPAISVMDTDSVVYRASDQYNLDEVAGTTADVAMPTWAQTAYPPLPKCKGQADLLIINIKQAFGGGAPPGFSMISLFIKVSDREE